MNSKSMKKIIFEKLGLWFLPAFVRLLCLTLRISIINENEINKHLQTKKNFIVAFWHGKMLVPWYHFRNKKITALISKSKDGEILSNLLKSFSYEVIRGSSNDGGKDAFEKMIESVKNKKSIAITVDGPKGPIYKMKAGAVVISHRTMTPLFLLGVGYDKFYQLKSWDKFQIPKPFSKVKLVFSNEFYVAESLSKDEIGVKILDAEKMLNDLQLEAEQF